MTLHDCNNFICAFITKSEVYFSMRQHFRLFFVPFGVPCSTMKLKYIVSYTLVNLVFHSTPIKAFQLSYYLFFSLLQFNITLTNQLPLFSDFLGVQYTDASIFQCIRCGRLYKSKRSLRRHVNVECGKEAALKCPFCNHCSKYKASITKHVKYLHPNMKYP